MENGRFRRHGQIDHPACFLPGRQLALVGEADLLRGGSGFRLLHPPVDPGQILFLPDRPVFKNRLEIQGLAGQDFGNALLTEDPELSVLLLQLRRGFVIVNALRDPGHIRDGHLRRLRGRILRRDRQQADLQHRVVPHIIQPADIGNHPSLQGYPQHDPGRMAVDLDVLLLQHRFPVLIVVAVIERVGVLRTLLEIRDPVNHKFLIQRMIGYGIHPPGADAVLRLSPGESCFLIRNDVKGEARFGGVLGSPVFPQHPLLRGGIFLRSGLFIRISLRLRGRVRLNRSRLNRGRRPVSALARRGQRRHGNDQRNEKGKRPPLELQKGHTGSSDSFTPDSCRMPVRRIS